MRIKRIVIPALSLLILTLLVVAFQLDLAQAQAPKGKPVTIRGKISAVEKQSLKVLTSAGEVLVNCRTMSGLAAWQPPSFRTLQRENMSARPLSSKPTAISRLSKSISSLIALAVQAKDIDRGISSPAQR
jgi:hypothetical protein